MRLALFQPDIPQNTGTMLRMAACLGLPVDIIEPAGFDVSDRNLRRSAMDYIDHVSITRYPSWESFYKWVKGNKHRLLIATVRASMPYTDFSFLSQDIIMMGRESAGFPDYVHKAADQSLLIPMKKEMRSLNIAVSAAMIVGEALRQCPAN